MRRSITRLLGASLLLAGCGAPRLPPPEARIAVVTEEANDQLADIEQKLAAAGTGPATPEIREIFGRHFAKAMEEMLDERADGLPGPVKQGLIREASMLTMVAQNPAVKVPDLKARFDQFKAKVAPHLAGVN